ncbi:processed acidic surface protein [Anoxybacillus tepidamans]|uniref:processed acidic surface protein n=1 Tax=Anoxybacteroides tepidamans TaxID=265948 RepID=UPI0004863E2E|nr:processed acidic surface protein [Anoxybacillus tepidamans]
MKKLVPFAIAASLAIATCPVSAFAIERNDPELQSYLNEINMTADELEEMLWNDYDMSLDDVETVDEIRDTLGEVLTEDNLQQLLNYYGLTEEELKQMLVDNGDLEPNEKITDVFKFYNELADYVDFLLPYSTPITEEALAKFLQERNMTKNELIALLNKHGESLDDYESIGDLADAVDYYKDLTPLTEETLKKLLDELGMTKQQLEKLLAAHGDSLSNYTTVEELSAAVIDYMTPDLDELGLTEAELQNLFNHLEAIDANDPQFASKMEEIIQRMEAIGADDFSGVKELSPAQIAEIADIMHDMLDLFQLDVKFYLTKNGVKKPLSLSTLMTMTSTNGYNLTIEIYNKQGQLLADLVLTPDMFNSDLFGNIGKDLENGEKIAKIEKHVKPKPIKRTEAGAKLPKTASPYAATALFGIFLIAAGAFLVRFRKGAA